MDILEIVNYSEKPAELQTGPTGSRYRVEITEVTKVDEEKKREYSEWTCKEFWLPDMELTQIRQGVLPGSYAWKDVPELHALFREAQHERTDNLYAKAYREQRTAEDPSMWDDYIIALDKWNAQISALAHTFSVEVPDLPQSP